MVFDILKSLKTYYVLRVDTAFPEKILNLIQKGYFVVWEVGITGEGMSLKCLSSDMPAIEGLLNSLGAVWEITRIRGAETLIKNLKRYKGIIFAAFACFVITLIFSGFVWSLEVYGARGISEQQVINCLYDSGVREGCLKRNLDREEIAVSLMTEFPSLSEAQVTFEGTRLCITLFERDSPAVIYDTSVAVDLVAVKDAVVDFIDVYNGRGAVEAGQSVAKGDILISGDLSYGSGEEAFEKKVHSMGKVLSYETAEFEGITVDAYLPGEGAKYKSIKTYYLFGRVFTVSDAEIPENPVKVMSYAQPVRVLMFSIPVLYDEIRCYNVDECIPKSEHEIASEIFSATQELLGDKCTITDITYSLKSDGGRRLLARVRVDYSESIAEQRPIGENDK